MIFNLVDLGLDLMILFLFSLVRLGLKTLGIAIPDMRGLPQDPIIPWDKPNKQSPPNPVIHITPLPTHFYLTKTTQLRFNNIDTCEYWKFTNNQVPDVLKFPLNTVSNICVKPKQICLILIKPSFNLIM